MNNIKVTIACITFNHSQYIIEAIESFLMQKANFTYEILIHDDASTDGTTEILKKYEEKFKEKIRVIYQTENQYMKGKRILPILYKESRGEYIALCEGDDFWLDPLKLQKQVDILEKNPKYGGCFHAGIILDAKTNKRLRLVKPFKISREVGAKETILGGGEFVLTNSIVFRSRLLEEFPEKFKYFPVGDYPLQILISLKEKAYYMKDIMSAYRYRTPGSWSVQQDNIDKNIKTKLKIIEMLEELNIFTRYEYREFFEYKKLYYEFLILKLKKNYLKMQDKKFEKIYHNLKLRSKLKLTILCLYDKVKRKKYE